MMSTIHGNGVTEIQCKCGDKVTKPNMIIAYNKYMGGVDKYDQCLNYYLVGQKSLQCWKCTFFRLVELAVVNAMVIYFHHNSDFRNVPIKPTGKSFFMS